MMARILSIACLGLLLHGVAAAQTAPPPTVTGLSPTNRTAGGPSFTLTVSGNYFTSSCSVVFGNQAPLSPTTSSLTQLTAVVPASYIASPGTVAAGVSCIGSSPSTLPFTINPPVVITTTSPLPSGSTTTAYSTSLASTGGAPPYTYVLLTGTWPPGLSLSSSGVISGTPTGGTTTYYPTIRSADTAGGFQDKSFSIFINDPLRILTPPGALPNGAVSQYYSTTLTAAGGTPPRFWTIIAGTLPPGLALAPSGVISGTPSSAGTFPFTARVSDSGSMPTQASADFSITIARPAVPTILTPSPLPNGMVGGGYSQAFTAEGGSPPYSWALAQGSSVPGLALNGNVLMGTPTTAGTYSLGVEVTDAQGQRGSKAFALTIAETLTITTASLPAGTAGKSYGAALAATGGTPPYQRWYVSGGALPPGLALSSTTGVISGTPTTAGTFDFTVTVNDSAGYAAARRLSITVGGPPPVITTTALPDGKAGVPYSATLTATSGTPPYTWSAGNLPAGLSLSAGGVLAGTPTAAGTFDVTVTVSGGGTDTKTFALNIAPNPITITTGALPGATAGVDYAAALAAAGGVQPYRWSIAGGALPDGIGLAADGTFSGKPAKPGSSTFTVQVTDSIGGTATKQFTVTVAPPPGPEVTTAALPSGVVAADYAASLAAKGGWPPYTWSVTAGSLPDGIGLDAGGALSGKPAKTGVFSFTAQVTDSLGAKGQKALTIEVLTGLTITTASLPAGTVGTAYSANLAASGGVPPITWSLAAGALPEGLTLSGTGTLSGTPAAAGSFDLTVAAVDSRGTRATRAYNLVINPPAVVITTATLPGGTVGADYAATLAATGGTPPFTWSVESGALPAGITLSGAGALSGRPSAAGTARFTARATDAKGQSGSRALSIAVVLPAAPRITIQGLAATSQPATQPAIDVVASAPYPVAISGRLTLAFTAAAGGRDDPTALFSTGSRTATYTIAAGQTRATFSAPALAVQTGTTAGRIDVTATVMAGGSDVTPSPPPAATTTIPGSAPTITSVRVNRTAGGFDAVVTGFTTVRPVTQATFRFTASGQGTLQTTDVTVAVDGAFNAWFNSSVSQAFGGAFTLTVPFTVSGNLSAISSVAVTLTNAQGASQAVSAQVQ